MTDEKITGEELVDKIKEISIAEFFEKNRHLLGYENLARALLTVVKEGVENSLDAAEEAGILPDIFVSVKPTGVDRFHVVIEDNGPGIAESKVPVAFAKFLVGSKFHRLRQSLAPEERILIKENDSVRILPIGDFIDSFLSKEDMEKDISLYGIRTLAFDWLDYKLKWKLITRVMRHEALDRLYLVRLESGREVKVTGSHSIFVLDLDDLSVKTKLTSEIKEGDFVIAANKIPVHPLQVEEINILDFLNYRAAKRHRWYVYCLQKSIFEYLRDVGKRRKISNRVYYYLGRRIKLREDHLKKYEKLRMLPVCAILALNLHKRFDSSCWKIKTYQVGGKSYTIPVKISVNNDFVTFLGFWLAEGHFNNGRRVVFDFGLHEKDYVKRIKKISKTLFKREVREIPDLKKNKQRLIIDSVVLVEFLRGLGLQTGTSRKSIPPVLINLKKGLKIEFLKALYAGDGTFVRGRSTLTYTTVSRSLASDLVLFLLSLGVFPTIQHQKKKGWGKKASNVYKVSVYGSQLNNLWFDVKHSRKSWPLYTGIPLDLIKKLGRFHDLPQRIERNDAITFLRFKEKITNETYMRVLNTLRNCGKIDFSSDFYCSQPAASNLIKRVGGYYEISPLGEEFLLKISKLKRLINSDFAFLKVIEVKPVKQRTKYVYDISVEGSENFVGGLGGIICHNSRGIQGIGIHGAVLYSQLTTGKPVKVTSSTGKAIHVFELMIDVTKNEPKVISHKAQKNPEKWHGVKVEMELEGKYVEKAQSVPEYLKQTAIANPFANITFDGPDGKVVYKRAIEELPRQPKEIKPHPHGVELGILRRMLTTTRAKNLIQFLTTEFSRVGRTSAEQICRLARIEPRRQPHQLDHLEAERLHKAMQMVKLISPPTNCLSPLGEHLIVEGLKKELDAEHFVAVTRPPSVYRGYPFIVECGLAYGGNLPLDKTAKLYRFANKIPLLYNQSGCAITESVAQVDWRRYGFSQSEGQLPVGPLAILVHFVSVWVPFTSEGKQAIANYPEIMKEIKLAVQDAGRKLATYIRHKNKLRERRLREELFARYIPELAESLSKLTGKEKEKIIKALEAFVKRGSVGGKEEAWSEKKA